MPRRRLSSHRQFSRQLEHRVSVWTCFLSERLRGTGTCGTRNREASRCRSGREAPGARLGQARGSGCCRAQCRAQKTSAKMKLQEMFSYQIQICFQFCFTPLNTSLDVVEELTGSCGRWSDTNHCALSCSSTWVCLLNRGLGSKSCC